jgi:hypothetical protein
VHLSIKDLLSGPEKDFQKATERVFTKNAYTSWQAGAFRYPKTTFTRIDNYLSHFSGSNKLDL